MLCIDWKVQRYSNVQTRTSHSSQIWTSLKSGRNLHVFFPMQHLNVILVKNVPVESSEALTLHFTLRLSFSHTVTHRKQYTIPFLLGPEFVADEKCSPLTDRWRWFRVIYWESATISCLVRKTICGLHLPLSLLSKKAWFLFVSFRQAEMWHVFQVLPTEWYMCA